MESILGVPVDILYRNIEYNNYFNNGGANDNAIAAGHNPPSKASNNNTVNNKPLLTRSEAETFVKVRLLAQELDVILQITEQVTERQHQAQRFQQLILGKGTTSPNPWLTPLLPLLKELTQSVAVRDLLEETTTSVPGQDNAVMKLEEEEEETQTPLGHHQDRQPSESADDADADVAPAPPTTPMMVSKTLLELHSSMVELVTALQDCAMMLWQSAEQNFALTDSLWDIVGTTTVTKDDDDNDNDNDTSKSSPTYILAKEKQALAELQEHVAVRIDMVLQWQYKDNAEGTSDSSSSSQQQLLNKRSQAAASFRTQLFGNSQSSQRQQPSLSQRSMASEGGEDRGIMSMEELFTPLEELCHQLFGSSHNNDDASETQTKNKENGDTAVGGKPTSTKTPPPFYEASQNSASAANTMMSLFQTDTTTATAMDPTVDAALRDGSEDSRDSASTTTTTNTRGTDKKRAAFEYPSTIAEAIPSRRSTTGAASTSSPRKRRWTEGEEENQMENSQFARASAAMSLASMVSGQM